jgi:hypothetical protein
VASKVYFRNWLFPADWVGRKGWLVQWRPKKIKKVKEDRDAGPKAVVL